MADQLIVYVVFAVKYESLLQQLQLMHQEHEKNTDEQRDKRGVKCNTQALGNPGNIALHRFVCLRQRLADSAHGSNKADLRNRPGNITNHRQFGLKSIRLVLTDRMRCAGDVLDISG